MVDIIIESQLRQCSLYNDMSKNTTKKFISLLKIYLKTYTLKNDLLRSFFCYFVLFTNAAFTVFFISIAMVIGPTPPGTGVIAPATF